MKKIVSIISILMISVIAFGQSFSANEDISWRDGKYYYFGSDEDISKSVTVSLYVYTDEETFNGYYNDIDQILKRYHILTNNKVDLTTGAENGVYDINENPNEWVSIPKDLYDLLEDCQQYSTETNGLFDITIGNVIDLWKEAIDNNFFDTISQEDFQKLITDVENLKENFPKEERLVLKEESDFFYAKIKSNVKLDLGAISKGYAIQKAKEYLVTKGVVYYQINAGASSINLGKFINRDGVTSGFSVTLTDPFSPFSNYGQFLNVADLSVTTSGNNNQYFLFNGRRYHHIISPLTFMPTIGISSVTIVGENSSELDAFSTAVFSMEINEAIGFLKNKGYSYSMYKDDGSLSVDVKNGITFKENEEREKPNGSSDNPSDFHYGNWILIGIISLVSIVLLTVSIKFIIKITKQIKMGDLKQQEQKEEPKIKKSTIRDIIMVASLTILIGAIFGIYSLWPKYVFDYVRIRKNNEIIAEIDYKIQTVNIPSTESNNDLNITYDVSQSQIIIKEKHGEEEHIIMIVGFDFSSKTAWVIEANCSDQSCVKIGTIRDSSKTIICLPNGIQIRFEE
ncbi:FAD:protein FMN transferase [Acholeplasma sp. OttesenSCG-928-E16]|nr:FAD:protein FMN transferase [Acholeplasma sp. OttesenSCG-928-E16]